MAQHPPAPLPDAERVLQGERHFARDNKSLGKFKLNGIRGGFSSKPQIEVTFDIYAPPSVCPS